MFYRYVVKEMKYLMGFAHGSFKMFAEPKNKKKMVKGVRDHFGLFVHEHPNAGVFLQKPKTMNVGDMKDIIGNDNGCINIISTLHTS